MSEFEASVDAWASALADPGQSAGDREDDTGEVMVKRAADGRGEPSVEIRIHEPDGERTVILSPAEARRLADRLTVAAADPGPEEAVGAED